jgi:tetratricopeptide (TPR) repeat protein
VTSEETIFAEALGKGSASERASFLDHACASNPELRKQVEHLLEAHEGAGGILEAPPGGLDMTAECYVFPERSGTMIGRYKLLERIGEGGFGTVFMAEQQHPVRRKVALKVLKPGMDTRQVIARFEAERQALALMEHENIAKVLDAGATESGRPYFVMELVHGVPITDFCDKHHLSPKERLELFVRVCRAVQHAHTKGVIHRDIKPTNVLVTLHDGVPVPKVIDFGVAKATGQQLTDKTLFTNFAQMVGTPLYMSPEQAEMSGLDMDTRSDIYSLGVLLYELLTGTTPFDKDRLRQAAQDEVRRIIREEEPPCPSTRISTMLGDKLATVAAHCKTDPKRLGPLVRGELDWIVMKALEKDRSRRYETANGLASDVDRYLHDETVQACPPTAAYRFRKFARRNRAALAGTLLLGVSVIVALAGITGGIGWAIRDRVARDERSAQERASRQAWVSKHLNLILDESARLEQAEKWPEALISARRAEPALAAGEVAPEIKERVRQVLDELELVRRLEEIRGMSGTVWGLSYAQEIARDPIAMRVESDYAAAFREAGIDIDKLSAIDAAARITARRRIAAAIVPALDDWIAVRSKGKDQGATQRLIDVLRIADPNPWRQRVRNCLERKDWSALVDLTKSPDLDRQPAATLCFLCAALRQQAESDVVRADGGGEHRLGHWGFLLEISILRRAQFNYPNDYWINHRLGMSLIWIKSPPQIQEGMGYLRAAMALRPHEAQVLVHLGHAHLSLGENSQAIACYRKAMELAPQGDPLRRQLAWHLTGIKARQWYGQAVQSMQTR